MNKIAELLLKTVIALIVEKLYYRYEIFRNKEVVYKQDIENFVFVTILELLEFSEED